MTEQKLVDKFLGNHSYLSNGAGSLSKKWGATIEQVKAAKGKAKELLRGDQKATVANYIGVLEEELVTKITEERGNLDAGEKILTLVSNRPLSPKEIQEGAQVDNIVTHVSNYWLKSSKNNTYTYSVQVRIDKVKQEEINFRDEFITFLSGVTPAPVVIKREYVAKKPNIQLVLPKQDSHLNKYDIYGDNNIQDRFKKIEQSTLNFLLKASATNSIEEIVYIVGSDQFNSEWTSLTTKGTPQVNILSYQGAFLEIAQHEIDILTTLLHYSGTIKVVYIPGNHDEYVGWHLIQHLQTYFRLNEDISFNTSIENTKYIQYNNSAIMLNHGDVLKPKDLAQRFPMGFKEGWSSCDHFYIFTGDRHHELSLDIQGIKFYQIPQLSSAKSKWDDKQGYLYSKAEQTAFVITANKGMSDIYKEILS